MLSAEDEDLLEDSLDGLATSTSKVPPNLLPEEDDGDDLDTMVVNKSESRGLAKPWMKFHKFTLVKTVAEVRDIVDAAIRHGSCGLDLETQGFDNRVNYDEQGKPSTVHQIVGFCVSVRGHGYYIPVRHNYDDFADKNPNVLPIPDVEAEISRLCWASQPVLTEEGLATDPLGSSKIAVPPKVVIGFWLAKFDQEFLYPVTGLEIWHPESFQCGHLAAFSTYSDDDDLGLKGKAESRLTIYDPDVLVEGKPRACPYEMIEFKELFEPNCKDRRFYNLYPTDNNEVTLYGCSDAICTELLCFPGTDWEHTREGLTYQYNNVVEKALTSNFLFTYRLEKQTVAAVRDLERQRAKIDHPKISALRERAITEQAKYDTLIRDLAEKKGFQNFNAGSPQQLSQFLFEEQGLNISPKPEKNEASKCYKTDASTLEKLAEEVDAPVLDWIVKYRQISKIMGTYLDSMSKNCDSLDQLRFKFNQTGAATARFTAPSGEPDHGYSGVPIQGIPARDDPKKPEVAHSLRSAFVAREGYTLVKVDYAGQELRVVANISGEDLWIHEFLHGEGDLHTLTAQAFFGPHITKKDKMERTAGKIANFSLIYGGGTAAIMRATKCDKVEAARRKANFDKSVPTFASWVKGQHLKVKKQLGVYNAFGRFLAIPDAMIKAGDLDSKGNPLSEKDANKIRASCERKSTNYPIQGSGADILKISLVRLVKEFHRRGWRRQGGDDSVRMIMTVHDEIVFEIKHHRLIDAVPVIIEVMESPSRLAKWRVPLIVEPLLALTWEAKYDWHEIMSGKEPVPSWLEGILVPGEAKAPAPPPVAPPVANKPVEQLSKPATPVQTMLPPADEGARSIPTLPSVTNTPGARKVATFTLSNMYLTERSVKLTFEAIFMSLSTDSGVYLKLVDGSGNLLINPAQMPRFCVDPEEMRLRMRDRNLGTGEYELKEEAL